MRKAFPILSPIVGAIILSLSLGGCAGDFVDEFIVAAGTQPTDMLNQLTAGDLADAFERFRSGISGDADRSLAAGLSDDQRAEIEDLQRRLDAGEITQEQFIAGVIDVLQDTTPSSPFAGFRFLGSPFSAGGVNDFADLLGLSAEQRQEGLLIYRLLHGDIGDVRATAKDEIRALLSAQQRAMLDQLSSELLDRVGVPDEQRAGAQLAFDLLILRLGLTFDQQAQIESVREDARAVVEQLHVAAREEFLALLGEEQLALLRILE